MRYLNHFFMETWDGWFFVLVNAVVMLFFVFLGNMGRGLMKGKMKIATKTWFWVIFIIYLVIQFFIGIGMYFYPHILPAFISTLIMIAGVIMNIRAKRTNKVADAINENRVNNLEVTQEISSVIKKDNPAEILVMEDGIYFIQRSRYS